jgi:hypothetical protein
MINGVQLSEDTDHALVRWQRTIQGTAHMCEPELYGISVSFSAVTNRQDSPK